MSTIIFTNKTNNTLINQKINPKSKLIIFSESKEKT